MAKKKYYDISNMLKTKAQYMMLLGQRANGKSYQVKKTILEEVYSKGGKFVYLRRYKEDIKQKAVESYFGDMPIAEITKGEYTGVKAWNGYIYFTRIVDGKEEKSKDDIGRYCSLNESVRYKSQTFVGYKYIVYEEFITDSVYLYEEPKMLQQFVSTVARLDTITVFLIGNTLSRVCPYFKEWVLDGVLNQKQGTIEVYHFHVEDAVIDIAVEYCANTNNTNKMFFGQTAKQIISGEWDTKDVPKLLRTQEEYEIIYEILISYQKFKFVLQLLVEPKNGGKIVFIYPYTGHRYIYRQLSDEFSDLPNITKKIDIRKKPEMYIYECFKNGKVCFSDNLTGSDFKQINTQFSLI